MFKHLDSHAKSAGPEERARQSELLFSSGWVVRPHFFEDPPFLLLCKCTNPLNMYNSFIALILCHCSDLWWSLNQCWPVSRMTDRFLSDTNFDPYKFTCQFSNFQRTNLAIFSGISYNSPHMEWSSLQMIIQRLIAEFALKLKLRILDSRMRREANYVQWTKS
jgi:hypothetical protein